MTTLITVGDNYGSRRCDAKCYNAESSDCDCVCNGRNHGAGLQKAQENVEKMAEKILAEHDKVMIKTPSGLLIQ